MPIIIIYLRLVVVVLVRVRACWCVLKAAVSNFGFGILHRKNVIGRQETDSDRSRVINRLFQSTDEILVVYIIRTVRTRTIIHGSNIHGVFMRASAFTSKTDFSFLPLNQSKITSIFVSQLV